MGRGDKDGMRKRMLARRRALAAAVCAQASDALCRRLDALPELQAARVVAAYAAFRNEIDPGAWLAAARARGVVAALPRMDHDDTLTLHRVDAGEPLVKNGLGVAEPAASSPVLGAAELDLILVPAVAVDGRGQRLGFGRGFYDRLLPTLPRALKVAVVHDFQLVDAVPSADHDVPVDLIVTDLRTLHVGAS